MSKYEFQSVNTTNLSIGDHQVVVHGSSTDAAAAAASLQELAGRLQACADDIRNLQQQIADLPAEPADNGRQGRIREFIGQLSAGAQTIATVAASVSSIRESIGHWV